MKLEHADVSSLATLTEAIRAKPAEAETFVIDVAASAKRRGNDALHAALMQFRSVIATVSEKHRYYTAVGYVQDLRRKDKGRKDQRSKISAQDFVRYLSNTTFKDVLLEMGLPGATVDDVSMNTNRISISLSNGQTVTFYGYA